MSRSDAWAFAGAGAGLLATALLPWPAAGLGPLLYGAAVGCRPWITGPVTILTLPFYLRPLSLGGLELSLAEIAIVVGCGALLAHWAAAQILGWAPEIHRPQAQAIDWAAAAMLGAGLLSLLVSEYPRQSLREFRWLLVEPIALLYILRSTIQGPREVMVSLSALPLAGVAAAVVSLGQLLAAESLADLSTRATAPYLSPNHLGLFLERAMAVALAMAFFGPHRPIAWGTLAAMGVAFARSLSLGAWAGFACSALVLAAFRGRRWLGATAAILALAAVAAFLALPRERTLERLDPTTGTALFRLQVWTSSVGMIADHPILGVGLDNFLYLYRTRYVLPEAWEEPNISHPHNWVLHFWVQLGLPGLVAAVGATLWTARTAHRRFRSPQILPDRPLGAAGMAVLAAFLVHGSVDNSYFLLDLAAVWWVLIGLLALEAQPQSGKRLDRMGIASVSTVGDSS